MNTILILFGVAAICFIGVAILSKFDKKQKKKFYSVYTPNGLTLIQKLEELFDNNGTLPFLGYIKLYNQMFNADIKSLDDFESAVGISGYVDEPEGTLKNIAGEYLSTLAHDLSQRHTNQYEKLRMDDEAEAMNKYGINIHSNEYVHEKITRVDWLEEKSVTTSINYSGYRYRIGDKLSYTFGSLSVLRNTTEYFKPIDRGTLYVTNKRIIFIGTEKRENRTVDLDNILEFSIFRDGILIGKTNGKKPLIVFTDYVDKPNRPPNKRDHLNRVTRVLDRVLRQNQYQEIPVE
jgi:hypothetical protein